MTVAEFIEELQKMPAWWPVVMYVGGESIEVDAVTRQGNHTGLNGVREGRPAPPVFRAPVKKPRRK